MPRIFDNIEQHLLGSLRNTLNISERADFCVGYFNLRGWRHIDDLMDTWQGGEQASCRLLIGMQEKPEDELRQVFSFTNDQRVDNGTVTRLKIRIAHEFREQLLLGAPSNSDQEGLRHLSRQLREKRLVVKLFLRHKLHAKLYLLYNQHPVTPIIGYLGSSNLTLAGLTGQGELNVDIVDYDACRKLEGWFNDRWEDRLCLDISEELATIIDESWAREEPIKPYYIYLKMAYHLSQEARTGLLEFRIPGDFKGRLFEYQVAAVKIAAHHLNKRGGVVIGDVVGLGKTLMTTALARIMQDDYGMETLILCPKNLVKMWKEYQREYKLVGEVLSTSDVLSALPDLPRFRLIVIDESHNLRNREGKRYKAIKAYIEKNESKCILLTATPYNKTYLDISAQLRLFLSDEASKDMGLRPERLLNEIGESTFSSVYQCAPRSLTAFEKSEYADDWRDLMRRYLVRRTRSFIQENYAKTDATTGRKYLDFHDGSRSYFPVRVPRTVTFALQSEQVGDQYARLYAESVIEAINVLTLPRYGLANYILPQRQHKALRVTPAETQQLASLSRAGKRLMGFCRTNLFKRLESGGPAFIQSIERHILRNYVFLHALEHGLELPLGTQNADLLDPRTNDEDGDGVPPSSIDEDDGRREDRNESTFSQQHIRTEAEYQHKAAEVYTEYATHSRKRFKWVRPTLFTPDLKRDIQHDARCLLSTLVQCGTWDVGKDAKLEALVDLLTRHHPHEKVLIFTQFADTVRYLEQHLRARGVTAVEGVTGSAEDPTEQAWRFSPRSNGKSEQVDAAHELRVLIATDVLSEGQNLQDAAVVVNYDLPWAIIRLIQRAGRVDRIGQHAERIFCYSFLPAEGVEQLIRLRARVRQRLQENAEVVGTDETFFEDDTSDVPLRDLYNEKATILDGEAETEVDLASQAYHIWKNATDANPKLKQVIEQLPNMVFSTRAHQGTALAPEGVLVYMRTAEGNDTLAWINRKGESVTQSQLTILRAAACALDTKPIARPDEQHERVQQGIKQMLAEELQGSGGQLGSPSGARLRTFERLKHYIKTYEQSLFPLSQELLDATNDLYSSPLREEARDTLNRQLRSGITDEQLASLVVELRAADRLCHMQEERETHEPHILCSLGLFEQST